ncbi:MAG: hypothetical protein H7Z42_04660, partial [Roseiflexaceae bacterium]|nr:hypothetical protein [Roseiflexaceae bacterium]
MRNLYHAVTLLGLAATLAGCGLTINTGQRQSGDETTLRATIAAELQATQAAQQPAPTAVPVAATAAATNQALPPTSAPTSAAVLAPTSAPTAAAQLAPTAPAASTAVTETTSVSATQPTTQANAATSSPTSFQPSEGGTTAQTVNIQLVFDSSGSMAEDIGGETKIAAARRSMEQLIAQLPEGNAALQVGFRVFGHRGDNTQAGKPVSCQSTELLVPMQTVDKAALQQQTGA